MIKRKTISAKSEETKFSSSQAKLMDDTAQQWLAKADYDFELTLASQPTDEECEQLNDAELNIAEALGFGESVKTIRAIEEARFARVRNLLQQRHIGGGEQS